MDWKKAFKRKSPWRVDDEATIDHIRPKVDDPHRPLPDGGRVVYTDERGRPRRLPADMSTLTTEDRDAAIAALSHKLGAPPPDMARSLALKRLDELRAAGRISEEHYERERARLESY